MINLLNRYCSTEDLTEKSEIYNLMRDMMLEDLKNVKDVIIYLHKVDCGILNTVAINDLVGETLDIRTFNKALENLEDEVKESLLYYIEHCKLYNLNENKEIEWNFVDFLIENPESKIVLKKYINAYRKINNGYVIH